MTCSSLPPEVTQKSLLTPVPPSGVFAGVFVIELPEIE
jgi:hypothetical protein